MKEGKLVPMEVTIQLLKDAMIASGGKTFLIDGFPRVRGTRLRALRAASSHAPRFSSLTALRRQ